MTRRSAEYYAPVDDWTPAAYERLHERQPAQAPGRVRLTVYPAATHSFDFNPPPQRNEYGKYLAYDADATREFHELPHADPLRREIGDPQGDHDHEVIEEGEPVEERDASKKLPPTSSQRSTTPAASRICCGIGSWGVRVWHPMSG